MKTALFGTIGAGLLFGLAAFGQSEAGTVQGTGVVEIQRRPELLRVNVQLQAKGKDVKEAVANLKARREEAVKKLTTIGAVKERIQVADATIDTFQDQQRAQLEMVYRERLQAGIKTGTANKNPPPVTVVAMLQAELPLKAADGEELLVECHALQEKIKAADLAGLKDTTKLSPEEAEIAEELEGMTRGRYGDNAPRRGEPTFLFVSRVSDQDHERSLAEAFQKARRQAAALAKAAGAELGATVRLRSAPDQEMDEMAYRARMYGYEPMARPFPPAEGAEREAVGILAGKVSLKISVAAEFNLKTGEK